MVHAEQVKVHLILVQLSTHPKQHEESEEILYPCGKRKACSARTISRDA